MRLVNGVFMGGGAKLIAYAGALRATREREIWFGGVAGSSAGAIVASLIASGMQPDDLEAAIPDGFAQVKTSKMLRFGKAVAGTATSLFESRGLRQWLDETLAAQIPARERDGPVTFAELHRATRIELYVLTMDLATGLPVVFCRRTTPDVEVAGAVAASAAIPGAFPAGRAVFDSAQHGAVVHQLVDGSSWANYPSFVFQDRSFRTWLAAEAQDEQPWSDADRSDWERETSRPLVGFILGDPEPLEYRNSIGFVPLGGPDVNRRFDRGPTYTSSKRLTYLFGSLLSSDWMRLAVGLALVIWVALSVVVLPVAFRRYSTWLALWLPDVVYPVALVGSLAIVVVAIVVAIAAIGGLIAETLLPAVKATLGVPLEVAPWIGLGEDSIVVRVPRDGLHTVDFDVDLTVRDRAIAAAHESVGRQLDDGAARERLEALFAGTPAAPVPYRRGQRAADLESTSDRAGFVEVVVVVVAAALVGVLAWWAANSAGAERIGTIVLAVILSFSAVGAAVWFVGGRAAQRAAARSVYGVGLRATRPERTARVMVAAGVVLLVVGGALSVIAMDDRSDHTVMARVLSADLATSDDDALNVYLMIADNGDELTVRSERHLRLNEQTFVRVGDESGPELTGALDDGRFAIAVVCCVLGLGLVTSGIRSHRWALRCARLGALVDDWQQT
jgi:predicted acylesterase/phospholipase RssA